MINRFIGGTAALALTLTLGTGVASAAQVDDRPVRGTEVCIDLVNGQGNVLTARTSVQNATAALDTALRATPVVDATVAQRRQELADAQALLRRTVENVTESLCKDAPVTPAPTTTPVTPAPTTTVPAPVNSADDLDCPDFPTQAAAQRHLNADRTDPDRLDRDGDGLACEQFFGEPVVGNSTTIVERPQTTVTTVVPTEDDDSVAVTGGSQVVTVPEGSASTGSL